MAVCGIMVAGLSPREEQAPVLQPERTLVAGEPAHFFASEGETVTSRPQIPLDVLLSHIERHVRLEQAAAQSFLSVPSADSLHSRTESPLVN
jgi:hypothetical protein